MSDFDEFDNDLDLSEFLKDLDRVEAENNDPPLDQAHDSDSFSEFDDFDPEALIRLTDAVELNNSSSSSRQTNLNPNNHSERSLPQSQLTSFFGSPVITRRQSTAAISPIFSRSPVQPNTSRSSLVYGEISYLEQDREPPPPPSPDTRTFHPFDRDALPTWVYPTNYPIRSYQYSIVKKAIFTNTLVALPTGLGKTFIAAVVMFNYYRWFPSAKIIFMAPTRPLVTQQIEACFNVCGLAQKDTVDMTGGMNPPKRKEMWREKRVFFLTPQVLQNDLQSRICPADQIVCVVVDEAHKATGNYAYTETIKLILKTHDQFRVLALTATPGTNIEKVQVVLDNLRIANVEIRTEDSMDIREYSFGKNIRTIVVRLDHGEGVVQNAIRSFRDEVFAPLLQRLAKFQAIYDEAPERNTPFQLMMSRKEFSMNAKNFSPAVKAMVQTDFSIGDGLSRAYDMLCQHGVGPFLTSIDQTIQDIQTVIDSGKHVPKEKARLLSDFKLKNLLRNLRMSYDRPDFVGHPKIHSLVNSIKHHFESNQSDEAGLSNTKVIVFSSYRSSVEEIVKVLSKHQPLIRCCSFVGQANGKNGSKGLNQKEQQEVVSKFKQGEINVIVATSIGEEGLDIGEVDLIVCYDSQSSPIRMLQRIGRTGRKRKGHCVLLMTEQEEKKYQKAKDSYSSVQRAIAQKTLLTYFKKNPYILPEGYQPACCKKRLNIGTYTKVALKGRRKAGSNLQTCNPDGTLRPEVLVDFINGFQTDVDEFDSLDHIRLRYWPLANPLKGSSKYLTSDVVSSPHKYVGHSYRTHQFISIVNNIHHRKRHPGESERPTNTEIVPQGVLYQKSLFKENKLFLPSRQPIGNTSLAGPSLYPAVNNPKPNRTQDDDEDFLMSLGPFITRGMINASDDEMEEPWNMPLEDSFEGIVAKNKGKERDLDGPYGYSYNPTLTSDDYKKYDQAQDIDYHPMSLDYEPILPDTQEIPIADLPNIHQPQNGFDGSYSTENQIAHHPKEIQSNPAIHKDTAQDIAIKSEIVNRTDKESFEFNDCLPKIHTISIDQLPKESLATSSTFIWNFSFPIPSKEAKIISEKRRMHYKALVNNLLGQNYTKDSGQYPKTEEAFKEMGMFDDIAMDRDLLDQLFNSPIQEQYSGQSPVLAIKDDEFDEFGFSFNKDDLEALDDLDNLEQTGEPCIQPTKGSIEKPIFIQSQDSLTIEMENNQTMEDHHESVEPEYYSDILPQSPTLDSSANIGSPPIITKDDLEPPVTPLFKKPLRRTWSDASEDSPLQLKFRPRGLRRLDSIGSPSKSIDGVKEFAGTIFLESDEETAGIEPEEPRRLKRLKRGSDPNDSGHRPKKPKKPKKSTKSRKREEWALERDNPFLDVEAERSSDECSTDDGEDVDEEGSILNSFINDGSSIISYQSSQGQEGSVNYRQDSMAMYRGSLFSPETLKLRREMGFR